MKTGTNMQTKSNDVQVDLKIGQEANQRSRTLCFGLATIIIITVTCVAIAVSYFCFLKRSDIQETDAVFITKDGETIQEHIKLTETEVILSGEGSTLIYDFSKGLKVYHWEEDDVTQDACYVESFNVSKFTSLDQLKSMMKKIKTNKPNKVDRNIEETFVALNITLNNLALGPASRTMCENKSVFFLQRVPDMEIRGDGRVKRQSVTVTEKTKNFPGENIGRDFNKNCQTILAHKMQFATRKKIGDSIVTLFETAPGLRSERDIQNILPIVIMKTPCLRQVSKDDAAYVLQKAELIRYHEDDVIEKQGENGNQFYIILDGKVSIYLDLKQDEKTVPTEDNPSFPFPPSRNPSLVEFNDIEQIKENEEAKTQQELVRIEGSSKLRDKKVINVTIKKDEKKSRKKYGHLVNTLGRYQSFGELALLYPNRKRNATVIADEATDIVSISYEVFKITLLDGIEKDLEEKRLFIQTHPFFSKWNIPMQRQLQWSLIRMSHKIGDTVIRQGDELSGIYFLVSGRARLAAEPMRHRVQFPELFTKPIQKESDRSLQKREDTSLTELAEMMRTSKSRRNLLVGMDPLTYIRRTDGYAAAEKAMNEKLVDICIIEEGEVVCDSELLIGLEFNVFSVVCSTACIFYKLDTKIFDRLIFKKSPFTLSMMKIMAETKLTRRMNTQQGQKMPIISPLLSKILDVRVVDPNADEKGDPMQLALAASRMDQLPRSSLVKRQTLPRIERSQTILLDWFMKGKTPLLQPITKDAIYYRELIQKRAKYREISRQRLPKEHRQVKSLERRIKDSFWFNLKEGIRASNTMKRLKLQNSDSTPVTRWK